MSGLLVTADSIAFKVRAKSTISSVANPFWRSRSILRTVT